MMTERSLQEKQGSIPARIIGTSARLCPITTEAMVAELPKKETAAAPGMGGMGEMM